MVSISHDPRTMEDYTCGLEEGLFRMLRSLPEIRYSGCRYHFGSSMEDAVGSSHEQGQGFGHWIDSSPEKNEAGHASRPLRSLREHNRAAPRWAADHGRPRPNGIACPKCGEELVDSEPNFVLLTHPPQHRIHCQACSYSGLRF